MTRAFIFPGQGAQIIGMGGDFAQHFSIARELFEEADDILGRRVSRVIFEGPEAELTRTEMAQVAIFVTSMAILRVIEEQTTLRPTMCGGLSLGEYTALCASNRISFGDALRLVELRGRLMSAACDAQPGAMAAIIGLSAAQVAGLERPDEVWVANLNCPGQVVISGTPEGIAAAVLRAKELGAKRALPLQVHGAFHSGLMRSAQEALAPQVMSIPLRKSAIRLVMNAAGDFVDEEGAIRQQLIEQVTASVRWEACVAAMVAAGCVEAVEIGPGRVLAGFNKRMQLPTRSVGRIEDLDLVGV